MTEAQPLENDEARALPIFPLPEAVLLPGSAMALHLFEPRYRALARACLTEGPRAMAIATLLPGYEAEYHGRPPIARIAGAGRIVAHHARPGGTFDLLLIGVGRVELDELPGSATEFRRACATRLHDEPGSPAHERRLEAVVALAANVPAPPRIVPLPPPELVGGVGRRLDLLCDRHFPTNEGGTRRAVLEAFDLDRRAAVLSEALAARVLAAARPNGAAN